MNERVTVGVRTVGAVVLAAVFFACAPQLAQAQTTVVLDAPGSESIDTMVRGGSYASTNYGGRTLETRASSDLSYVRRAMMKFDTETRIPARTPITSAYLTLTVKAANDEARRLAAYRVVYSFDEDVANWSRRKSGINWAKAGGDFGAKYAEATVGSAAGSKVTFDVTRLVQETVNGNYGSRWTRIAVIDPGASSRDSWREFYSSETSTASLRPTLTVVHGGSGSTTQTSGTSGITGSTSSSLPSGWSSRDIGSVGRTGTASGSLSTLTAEGAGADVWGSSDAFRFVYRTLNGDGSIVTRVAALERVNGWTKAGVMMRESLASNSRHAFMLVSPGKGLAFQRRTSTGGSSSSTSGGSGVAPYWVKLTRSGSTFSAYKSTNGSTWTRVASQSISMGSTIYVGVAVSSHVSGTLATATFSSTDVEAGAAATEPSTADSLPSGWSSRDIGSVGRAGSASGTTSSLTVEGGGADVWGRADAFRFVYRTLSGDGTVVTRVTGLERVSGWTKAGVMMRESLANNSRHAFMLVSPSEGLAFQRRTSTGGSSYHTSGGSGVAPYWVKLTRSGSTFTAYKSTNGTSWTRVGSQSISMASTIYVGVAVSSHVSGTLATGTFASTAVTAGQVSAPVVEEEETAPPTSEPAPAPAPAPSTSGTEEAVSGTLRLLHWNSYHGGRRTDGVYDPAGFVSWIVKFNPDVITLNEVDTESQATAIMNHLKSKMPGVPWKYYFLGHMKGNMIVSRLPMTGKSMCLVNSSDDRRVAHISVLVNNRPLNVWDAHLSLDSSSERTAETRNLQACERNWAEARIAAGDYNMQAGSAEYKSMTESHVDAWVAAKAMGKAYNYSGNCDGCTRRSRIDYVFTSKNATWLRLKSAQIFDTRNSKGVAASDHKPLLVIYDVR